ncbi:unnamed protein product [Pneumocystis jirovecii]|uniref:Uncharacterized protein n=1 Tax=Pneumocystis jirovecii TaxID=42068 RepID=L0P964_PNEJI|nr:unnamed protein product [Pneumocystis jirovecii]
MESDPLNLEPLYGSLGQNRSYKTSELFKSNLIRSLDILIYSHIVYFSASFASFSYTIGMNMDNEILID